MSGTNKRPLTVAEIITLHRVMPKGREAIKTRLKSLSLTRDIRAVKEAIEIIEEEINRKVPEKLKVWEDQFRELYSELEAKAKKNNPDQIDYMELELSARVKFKNYDQMKALQKEVEEERRKYMKEPFPLTLHTSITESDLPKEISPEAAEMAVIYMDFEH